MRKKYGILSDDLTGAMDAGLGLIKKGIRVVVTFNWENMDQAITEGADIIIADTESRNIEPIRAYSKVRDSVDFLMKRTDNIIYKKIDSTLRGNIGKELDAVLDTSGKKMIVMAPALPYNKRTTLYGIHYVDGKKLEETELAKDPFAPVPCSYIPDIIRIQSNREARIIDISAVRKGKEEVQKQIKKAYDDGISLVVIDAVTEDDLAVIADTVSDREDILACGSAGLLEYIEWGGFNNTGCENIERGKIGNSEYDNIRCKDNDNKDGIVLIIAGSPAEKSRQQLEYAKKLLADNVGTVKLREDMFNCSSNLQDEKKKLEEQVEEILSAGKDLILEAPNERKEDLLRKYKGRQELLNRMSDNILGMLSHLVSKVIRESNVKGLVLLGGDTAYRICTGLGSHAIEIIDEIDPYVPAGILIGGECHGLKIVTKAGGFGVEETVVNAIEYIRGGLRQKE